MRELAQDHVGKSYCLAVVGAHHFKYVESFKGSEVNIILDGCSVGCGERIFKKEGLPYKQFVMTDFKVIKNVTEISQDIVERVISEINSLLGQCID